MQKNSLASIYGWSGITADQQRISGEDKATSAILLKATLQQRGIRVIKIHRKRNSMRVFFNKKISSQKITDFYQQLTTLLSSGVPMVTALQLNADSCNNTAMCSLIIDIKTYIENGKTLSEALAYYPNYFDLFCCHLICAGEQIGDLSTMVTKIIEYRTMTALIKRKITKALYYPCTVLFIACAIIFILLLYIVPELQSLFLDFGHPLPAYTRGIIEISVQLRSAGWSMPFLIAISYPIINRLKTKGKINIPFLNSIIEKYLTARWTHTLAITLGAGIPLAQSLYIISKTLPNLRYQQSLEQIREKIIQGQNMYAAMQPIELFPTRVKQMIYIGEYSGTLPIMLTQMATFYQREASDQTEMLLSLLEPLLIIILGVIIGGIVIAMYLPIFKLGSIIQ